MSCSAFLMCIYTSTSHECPHTHTATHTNTSIHTCTTHIPAHSSAYNSPQHIYLNTYIHRYTSQHIYKYLSTHIHLHIHTCTCHMYIPIHSTAYDTYTHTHTHTEPKRESILKVASEKHQVTYKSKSIIITTVFSTEKRGLELMYFKF